METSQDHRAPSADELDAWSQFSFLLLEACAQHTVAFGAAELEAFRKRIEDASENLKRAPSAAQVLVAAGSLTHTLEEYSRQTQRRLEANDRMLRGALSELWAHSAAIHSGLPSAGKLEELRLEFHEAGGGATIPGDKLSACLEALALESRERHSKTNALLNQLKDRLAVFESNPRPVSSLLAAASGATSNDPCTGLPLRVDADAAIRNALHSSDKYFVAAFYIHRMNLTNARFGESIGNQVILFCSQHIAGKLARGEDSLFRWMGPAFVALLQREESEASVSSEVQRVVSTPLNRFFETNSRTVYLPMKLSGESFSLSGKTEAEVADRLEKFFLRVSQSKD